ncbi:hypothetical protein AB6A40_003831 [Gnathostoma spinigerum]|uniref:Uncharacterized protein n=1 Tax=Gnathostoma spinigerum TaxID=75299 RepID=A0ABD6EKM2_9BILA
MHIKYASVYLGFFLIIYVVDTLANATQPQICWNGMDGVINGQVGNATMVARPCKNPNALCVSMTYCARSNTIPEEYEYGYAHYCQDEPIATLPAGINQKCNIAIKGITQFRKECRTVLTNAVGDNNIVYRMCCFPCPTNTACNFQPPEIDSPCNGQPWSRVPMTKATTTATRPTTTTTKTTTATTTTTKTTTTTSTATTTTSTTKPHPSTTTKATITSTHSSNETTTKGVASFANSNIAIAVLVPFILFIC